jgi:hypothetical protein
MLMSVFQASQAPIWADNNAKLLLQNEYGSEKNFLLATLCLTAAPFGVA